MLNIYLRMIIAVLRGAKHAHNKHVQNEEEWRLPGEYPEGSPEGSPEGPDPSPAQDCALCSTRSTLYGSGVSRVAFTVH